MKKVLFTLAMVMGLGTSVVFAQDPVKQDSTVVPPVESPAVEQAPQSTSGEFKAISAEELPSTIIEALKKDYPNGSISGLFAAENASGKIYKVIILKDKNDATSEETLLFNEKGEKVSE